MADDSDEQVRAILLEAFERARAGDVDRLSEMLDAGVPADLTNSSGDTLLILAAYHVHVDAVRVLLDRKADPDRVNDNGQTAIAAATFRQDTAIVAALLSAGADPDAGARSARIIAKFFDLPAMQALLPRPCGPLRRTAAPETP